jgi:hypothetical protein
MLWPPAVALERISSIPCPHARVAAYLDWLEGHGVVAYSDLIASVTDRDALVTGANFAETMMRAAVTGLREAIEEVVR